MEQERPPVTAPDTPSHLEVGQGQAVVEVAQYEARVVLEWRRQRLVRARVVRGVRVRVSVSVPCCVGARARVRGRGRGRGRVRGGCG